MRQYETIFVMDPALDGDAVEGELDRVVKMIEGNEGTVVEVQKWGKRRLAYPIKKRSDGVYTYVRFDGNNAVLEELNRRFRLNEDLLRHMTVLLDHPYAKDVRPSGVAGSTADTGDDARSHDGEHSRSRDDRSPRARSNGAGVRDDDDDDDDTRDED